MPRVDTKKTSLYLDTDLLSQTQALSSRTGQPASEIYRRAIRDYLACHQATPKDTLVFAVQNSGKFNVTACLTLDECSDHRDPALCVSFDDGKIQDFSIEAKGGFSLSLDLLDRCELTGLVGYIPCQCDHEDVGDCDMFRLDETLPDDDFYMVVEAIFDALKQKLSSGRRAARPVVEGC